MVDRDTREPQVLVLEEEGHRAVVQDVEDWLRSGGTGVRLRPAPRAGLELQVGDDAATRERLPT